MQKQRNLVPFKRWAALALLVTTAGCYPGPKMAANDTAKAATGAVDAAAVRKIVAETLGDPLVTLAGHGGSAKGDLAHPSGKRSKPN